MRTRTKGIQLAGAERIVNKQYKGQRIFQRLGAASQGEAETWLRQQQADIDAERANSLRRGDERMWAAAATKYLKECAQRKVRTLEMISRHVTDLLPYIGSLPMQDVCNDALEAFKLDRLDDGVKHATINRSLEVVRTTLIRSRAGVARRRTALVDDGASDRDAGRSCAKARTLSDHLG